MAKSDKSSSGKSPAKSTDGRKSDQQQQERQPNKPAQQGGKKQMS